jgi:hypothetical protein
MSLRCEAFAEIRSPRYRITAAILLVLAVLIGAPAIGRGAQLDITPNPAQPNGAEVWLSGCGYVSGKQANVTIYGPDAVLFFYPAIDSSGCLVPYRFWTSSAGDYAVEVRQALKGKRQSLMSSGYLEVY